MPINVPRESQQLTFSKSGGQPRLAIGFRPQESLAAARGLGWACGWLTAGAILLLAVLGSQTRNWIGRRLDWMLLLGGAGWFALMLPGAFIGLALVAVGAARLAFWK